MDEEDSLPSAPVCVSGAFHLQHQIPKEEGVAWGARVAWRLAPRLRTHQLWLGRISESPLHFWKRHFGPRQSDIWCEEILKR